MFCFAERSHTVDIDCKYAVLASRSSESYNAGQDVSKRDQRYSYHDCASGWWVRSARLHCEPFVKCQAQLRRKKRPIQKSS